MVLQTDSTAQGRYASINAPPSSLLKSCNVPGDDEEQHETLNDTPDEETMKNKFLSL